MPPISKSTFAILDNTASKRIYEHYEMLIGWINDSLNSLSDEDLKLELSEGKNHGIWILGHLIASDDDLSEFLGKGGMLFPEYQEMFGQRSKLMPPENYPDAVLLRKHWDEVSKKNLKIYSELKDKELDEHHALINDIERDYFKTKARVIMAWLIHQAYHEGQLAMLVSKAGKSKY